MRPGNRVIPLFIILGAFLLSQSNVLFSFSFTPLLLGLPTWTYWFIGTHVLLIVGLYLLMFRFRHK